jgi:hypothetical protein
VKTGLCFDAFRFQRRDKAAASKDGSWLGGEAAGMPVLARGYDISIWLKCDITIWA